MKPSATMFNILSHTVLIIGAVLVCFPVWMVVVASTHPPEALAINPIPMWFGDRFIENYHQLLFLGIGEAGGIPLWLMLGNSLVMALGITIGKVLVSIMAAFAIVYFRFRFRMTCFWLIFLTLMLPVEVRILPTYDVVVKLGLLNSYVGLCVPLIASATATFLFRQFFMTIPAELVESAKMDRAGALEFLRDILLPLSRTNILALFIILFIYGWNQYLWPLIITTDVEYTTIMMGIQRMVNSGESFPVWHLIMGSMALALLPPVAVILLLQRFFVKGLIDSEK